MCSENPERASAAQLVVVLLVLAVVLGSFLKALWVFPVLRAAAAAIAPGLEVALYSSGLIFLAVLSVCNLSGRRDAIEALVRPLRFPVLGASAGLLAIVLAFWVEVAFMWHERKGGGIAGILPWADSELYFGGAERLLFFGRLDEFNSGRPFTAMFNAALLAINGLDLRRSIMTQAALVGVACYVTVKAVKQHFGTAAALVMLAGFFGYSHSWATRTTSEAPGIIMGALAFGTLWRAVALRWAWLVGSGLFLLAIAFEVRGGPAIVLLVLPLWFAWYFRGERRLSWKLLGLFLAISISGTCLSRIAVGGLGGRTENMYATAIDMMYPMSYGLPSWNSPGTDVGWHKVFTDHPEILRIPDQVGRTLLVRGLAAAQLRAHPEFLVQSVLVSAKNYAVLAGDRILAPVPVSARGVVAVCGTLAAVAALAIRGLRRGWRPVALDASLLAGAVLAVPLLVEDWRYTATLPPEWLGAALMALAFLAFAVMGSEQLPHRELLWFWVAAALGLFASVPLLGGTGGRVFAACLPIFVLPFALAAAVIEERSTVRVPEPMIASRDVADLDTWVAMLLGTGFALFIIAGAPAAMAVVDLRRTTDRRCADGIRAQPLVGGVALGVVEGTSGNLRIDQISRGDFIRALEPYSPYPESVFVENTSPPMTTIIAGLTESGGDRIAFVPGDVEAPGQSVLALCGRTLTDPITDDFTRVYPGPFDLFAGSPATESGDGSAPAGAQPAAE